MARLQLDLSDTYEALIEKLQPLCDLRTKKDVVENALLLLGWAATEASNGLAIAAVDEDRRIYREVHAAALEGAKTYKARKAKQPEPELEDAPRIAAKVAAVSHR
jgi:hypothetical protein